jgi:hypothetical protein
MTITSNKASEEHLLNFDEKYFAWISENAKYYSEYKNVMQTFKSKPYDLLVMLHMNWKDDDPKIKTITTWINSQNVSQANVDNTLQLTTGTRKLFGRSDSIIETVPQQAYLIRAEIEAKSCPASMAIFNEGPIRSLLAVSETVKRGKKQIFMLFMAEREKTVISFNVKSTAPNQVANVYKVDLIKFDTLHINCWSFKKNNEKYGYSQMVESWFPTDGATLSLTTKGQLEVTTGNKKLYGRGVSLVKTQPGKVYKISACIEADSSPACIIVRPLESPQKSNLFNSLAAVSGHIVNPGRNSYESVTFVAKSAVTQVQMYARSTLPGKKIRVSDVECIEINNIKALLKVGSQFKKEGKLDEALAVYQQATELNPNFSWLYQALGEIYAIQERWEEALSVYQKAVELNGDSAWIAHGLGRALAGIGRFDEAIAHYRSAIEMNPECSIFYKNLGIAFAEKGQLKEASIAHEKFIRISPNATLTKV